MKKQFILPLRLYHSLTTLLTLALCCGVSSILVYCLDSVAGLSL